MLNHVFFYVSLEEINEYCSTFPSHKYVYIPGTLGNVIIGNVNV